MAKERLIFQLHWYSWMLTSLYECIIGIFMSLLSIGGLVVVLGHHFGWASATLLPKTMQWYEQILVILFGCFLGWVAIKAFLTSGMDLIFPAITYEGRVKKLERIYRPRFRVWIIDSGDKYWHIPIYDVPDNFRSMVDVGSQVRITYRRGTGWVTSLTVLKD